MAEGGPPMGNMLFWRALHGVATRPTTPTVCTVARCTHAPHTRSCLICVQSRGLRAVRAPLTHGHTSPVTRTVALSRAPWRRFVEVLILVLVMVCVRAQTPVLTERSVQCVATRVRCGGQDLQTLSFPPPTLFN